MHFQHSLGLISELCYSLGALCLVLCSFLCSGMHCVLVNSWSSGNFLPGRHPYSVLVGLATLNLDLREGLALVCLMSSIGLKTSVCSNFETINGRRL